MFSIIPRQPKNINKVTGNEWLKTVWPQLREGYSDQEIFNMDKTSLFFHLTSNKTLNFKSEKYVSGKLSKECLTVLVFVKMGESKKQSLTVMGKNS